jgi:hypothetical protein
MERVYPSTNWRVFVTKRVLATIYADVAHNPGTETAGAFLGHMLKDGIHVIDVASADEKHDSFSVARYENETDYLDQGVQQRARTYHHIPQFIGIWHRHPDGCHHFSAIDDGTHRRLCRDAIELRGAPVCLSLLVTAEEREENKLNLMWRVVVLRDDRIEYFDVTDVSLETNEEYTALATGAEILERTQFAKKDRDFKPLEFH